MRMHPIFSHVRAVLDVQMLKELQPFINHQEVQQKLKVEVSQTCVLQNCSSDWVIDGSFHGESQCRAK